MSLLAYMFSEFFYADPIYVPTIYDQYFGLGMSLQDFQRLNRTQRMQRHYKAMMNPHGFKVIVDVQQFRPEDLTIKVENNSIIIEGKHEERKDEHGTVSRYFKRRYLLPDDIDEKQLMSSLSSDGILQITAPKKGSTFTGERTIPITCTNAPGLEITNQC